MRFIILTASIFNATAFFSRSRPQPGCVGVYYHNKALVPMVQRAGGWNIRNVITYDFVDDISIQPQSDHIHNVECGSKDGITLTFPKIVVYNTLVDDDQCILKVISGFHIPFVRDYDQLLVFSIIQSEVLQFCKDYSFDEIYITKFNELDELLMSKLKQNLVDHGVQNCLKITDVRLTRPTVSPELVKRFEEIEMEKKKKVMKEQEKITQQLENEIAEQKAVGIKNTEKAEQKVELEKLKEKVDSDKLIQEINNEIQLQKDKSIADSIEYAKTSESNSEKYRREKEIEAINGEIKSLGGVDNYLERQRIHAHRDAKNIRTHWFAGNKEHMPTILMPGMSGSDQSINKGDIKSDIPTDGTCPS